MIWDNVNGSGETGKKTIPDFKRIEFQNAILEYLQEKTSEVYYKTINGAYIIERLKKAMRKINGI